MLVNIVFHLSNLPEEAYHFSHLCKTQRTETLAELEACIEKDKATIVITAEPLAVHEWSLDQSSPITVLKTFSVLDIENVIRFEYLGF